MQIQYVSGILCWKIMETKRLDFLKIKMLLFNCPDLELVTRGNPW